MATPSLWITLIGWATKAVLILLAGLSIWSISILIDRRRRFANVMGKPDAQRAKELLRAGDRPGILKWAEGNDSLQASSIREVLQAPQSADAIAYAQKAYLADRRSDLSRGLPVLATLGSNAPFIGLFGTVLGIIQSFAALATSNGAMNQVIASLAEALTATAAGLFVAIPATIGYNVYTQKIRAAVNESESLRDLYLSRFVFKDSR
ncbi:MAG: MotA/TolQ/ExbB proton channel family protein [Cryobacterium sp.]|nr:MotA/TolQ/ExbB proton channel family protein [Oligoflexia bacterium]